MSLKFTALEVGSGDAFLLEDGDRKILFDAGGSRDLIIRLLKKKKIKKIDLAICSHNDKDHSNGFIGLLNSKIGIGEIWLPGTWASIIHSVVGFMRHGCYHDVDKCCRFDVFLDCRPSFEFDEERCQRYYDELLSSGEEIPNDQLMKDLDRIKKALEDGRLEYCRRCKDNNPALFFSCYCRAEHHLQNYSKCFRETISEEKYHIGEHAAKLMIQLDTIISIAVAAFKKSVNIRWFKPTDACIIKRVDTNIIALNSYGLAKEVRVSRIDNLHMLMFALTLTMENKYSLAMEYLYDDIPVVRFSADADCICQSRQPYQQNIIVTAPHHGSGTNKNVYTNIKGNDIIWVRSDAVNKTQGRPCVEFKKQVNKYCLSCIHRNPVISEICFEYDESKKQWICNSGERCVCLP